MMKQTLIAAVALALTCGTADAGERNKLTKEEGTGMLTGAAAGAIVGGPIGAAVGLMVGGIMGDNIGIAKRADLRAQKLEQDLVDTRMALAEASERTGGDEILDALAASLRADVMFRTASADVDADLALKMEELGKLLGEHPQLVVQLHGFADPRGKSEENLKLSHARADAVREVLIRGGASPEQIQLSAHGEDLTTAAKDDVEAYAWERRVSLTIQPNSAAQVAQTR